MYQDECCQEGNPPQCGDQKDPKKAVELSIVILVDNEQEEKCAPPPPPCPCPPPCCLPPCCMPMSCCMPMPMCPCSRMPYAGQQQQQPQSRPSATACSQPPSSRPCTGSVKPICIDMRTKQGGEMDTCGNLVRVKSQQSTASCQTDTCQPRATPSQTASCQTVQCQPQQASCQTAQCQPQQASCQTAQCQPQPQQASCQTAQRQPQPQQASCQTAQRQPQQSSCQTAQPQPQQAKAPCKTPAKSAICQTYPQPEKKTCPQPEKKKVCKGRQKQKQRPASGETGETPEPFFESGGESTGKELAVSEEGVATTSEQGEAPKHKHHHKHGHKKHGHHHRRKSSGSSGKHRRPSIPADQINFSECPTKQTTFVKYFLKYEGGAPYVTNLAQNKMDYERDCKIKLSKFPKTVRYEAQEFFLKVVDTVNTPTPDTQHTEVKHFHIMKYLHPVLQALSINSPHECHSIHKFHNYILAVVKRMDRKLQAKEMINPTCMIEIETQLLAGIVRRFFPIFIKVKDELLDLIKQGKPNQALPPEEFLKQIKKLLLCVYVEIACIDATFTNTLTSMNYLPDVNTQEVLRQQLGLRKKHARHATKWAARCLATTLLYYFMIDL